ncbi:unnamed protein product [Echinostoma caproni]|uniref:Sema domain-containing protein n=1 Tax=Echinostoma caproni TaxID=27848 RepID=A0A183AAR4_9TREM|nr:unnamed protein product [Echinostoma caproni]
MEQAPCEEQAAFNLLSKTRDGQNLWYCYIYQTSYMKNTIIPNVDSARCEIPSPMTLEPSARLVQWENSVYSSLDLRKPGVYLMANDGFLYTSGWFHGALHIHRVLLPNFNGLPNWDQFLTTPDSPDFIREPATFIAVFETNEEVYFLFRESQLQSCPLKVLNRPSEQPAFPVKTAPLSDSEGTDRKHGSTVTRLARVCKGDRGGYVYVNEGEFVTFAKATVECTLRKPVSNRSTTNGAGVVSALPDEEYTYTHAEAGLWDPIDEQLYITFGTPSGHPRGVALCIYTKQSIVEAFESDLLSSNLADDSNPTKTIPNNFPNICSRFSSNTLSEMELDQGRRLPRGHLLRAKSIQPIGNGPILVRPKPGQPTHNTDPRVWKHMAVDHVASTKILYLATDVYVERYRIIINEGRNSVDQVQACFIDRFQVGDGDPNQESITGLHLLKRFPASEFYILSTKHVIRLSVTGLKCSRHASRVECLSPHNPYCVWDSAVELCETATFVVPTNRHSDSSVSVSRKESAIWSEQTDATGCDRQAFEEEEEEARSSKDWQQLLNQVNLTEHERFDAPLPCAQLTTDSNADGSAQQNLTCWCRPCTNCGESKRSSLEIVNCTIGIRTRTRQCDSPGPVLIPMPDGSISLRSCESDGADSTQSPNQEIQLEQCVLRPVCGQTKVVNTKWTGWFQPPTKHAADDSTNIVNAHLRQRLRFTCQAPNATTRDLRIGRVHFMEHRCAPWNGICTPVTDKDQWSSTDLDEPSLDTAGSSSSSFGSSPSSALGHWSSWGPWTPCNQACVPPVSVTATANHRVIPVTPYSAPLYLHGGIQSRRRTCLFASVYDCPGGPSQANESRACPPVPACHTDWSCWSDWSTCQARPATNGDSMLIYPVASSGKAQCEWKTDGIRKRVRQCVLGQSDWLANRPPACSGPMDETESCPRLVGQGTPVCPPAGTSVSFTEERHSRFTILQLLLIGSLAFLIAAFLVALILIILYCTCCSPTDAGRKAIHRHSNVYDQAEGSGSETQFDEPASSKHYHSRDAGPLNVTGPPQPLLTLPTSVKADIMDSRLNRTHFGRTNPPQAVYDSVASQDLPTSFSLTENPFHMVPSPYTHAQSPTHPIPRDSLDRAYWSLPRRERTTPHFTPERSKPDDYVGTDHFNSYPRRSRTFDSRNFDDFVSTSYGNRPIKSSHPGPGRQPEARGSAELGPRYNQKKYGNDREYSTDSRHTKSRTRRSTDRSSDNSHRLNRNEEPRIDPMRPLYPEDGDSFSCRTSNNSSRSDESRPSNAAGVPPSMPLLPVRYPPGGSRTSERSRSATGASIDSSMDWGPDTSSGRSEIYSICFERPQNPHLRDPSSQGPSPTERGRSAHNT